MYNLIVHACVMGTWKKVIHRKKQKNIYMKNRDRNKIKKGILWTYNADILLVLATDVRREEDNQSHIWEILPHKWKEEQGSESPH